MGARCCQAADQGFWNLRGSRAGQSSGVCSPGRGLRYRAVSRPSLPRADTYAGSFAGFRICLNVRCGQSSCPSGRSRGRGRVLRGHQVLGQSGSGGKQRRGSLLLDSIHRAELGRGGQQTSKAFEQSRLPFPKLTLTQGALRTAGVAFPLNASLSGSATGATIVIDGLARGSTLNVGRASGAGGWRLSAADLDNALVQPPPGFVGPMDLVLELRLADDIIADRKGLHLEWIGALPFQGPRWVLRQLDREEISALLKRGENFIADGDLASARLVLQRAAEGGDRRAALRLAGT